MPPVIVMANDRQFRAHEVISFPRVQSCMLLWCKSGMGKVEADNQRYLFTSGTFLLLPWDHAVAYYPDAGDPFLVAGVHLIPDHHAGHPVEYSVAHRPDNPLADHPSRRDGIPPVCTHVLQGTFSLARELALLADYIVACFQRNTITERLAYQLGAVFLDELHAAIPDTLDKTPFFEDVKQVINYLQSHYMEKVSLHDLADTAGCSPATLIRHFRRQLRRTPFRYLLELRMEHAARLLATTRLPVGEVGLQAGLDDPYYFSKAFRQYHCVTPTAYRETRSLIR
ncbi:MAG: AraC family transcriptional regulator [bacterium]|nr:AraC family transcriptional regulator [bacterium]